MTSFLRMVSYKLIVLGHYFNDILKEVPYVVAGSMQRHQQTAQLCLDECFPES